MWTSSRLAAIVGIVVIAGACRDDRSSILVPLAAARLTRDETRVLYVTVMAPLGAQFDEEDDPSPLSVMQTNFSISYRGLLAVWISRDVELGLCDSDVRMRIALPDGYQAVCSDHVVRVLKTPETTLQCQARIGDLTFDEAWRLCASLRVAVEPLALEPEVDYRVEVPSRDGARVEIELRAPRYLRKKEWTTDYQIALGRGDRNFILTVDPHLDRRETRSFEDPCASWEERLANEREGDARGFVVVCDGTMKPIDASWVAKWVRADKHVVVCNALLLDGTAEERRGLKRVCASMRVVEVR